MQDLLLDENGDLNLVNGDVTIGEATLQHQNHIILAQKGEYKQFPEIGVGVRSELLSENPRALLVQIRRNFEYDGMTVNTLRFADNGNILIDASYN